MKKDLLDKLCYLQEKYNQLKPSLKLDKKQEELALLQKEMELPDFWNNQNQAQKISQSSSRIEKFLKNWEDIASSLFALSELVEISEDAELPELETELIKLEKKFQKAETHLLLSGEYDTNNVILSIHVGNGGQDAEDFCSILLRMYLRYAERKGYKTTILDESPSDDGLKSATVEITGDMAYGYLKSENGVHRLIRLSPFNAKNLRQTSFAKIEVLPEIENDMDLDIDPNDIRIDVFRSSGAGGQSVNTTDSAVRITYLPLNQIVTCQNEKSQLQNKDAAMKVLKSRLLKLKLEQQAQQLEELRSDNLDANFGSQIRTYTLQPYKLVKDHRTNYEETIPDKVFDGELDGFSANFLQMKKLEKSTTE